MEKQAPYMGKNFKRLLDKDWDLHRNMNIIINKLTTSFITGSHLILGTQSHVVLGSRYNFILWTRSHLMYFIAMY